MLRFRLNKYFYFMVLGGVTSLLVRHDVWEINTGKMAAKREDQRLALSAFRKQLLYSSAGGKEQENMVVVLPREGVNPVSDCTIAKK